MIQVFFKRDWIMDILISNLKPLNKNNVKQRFLDLHIL